MDVFNGAGKIKELSILLGGKQKFLEKLNHAEEVMVHYLRKVEFTLINNHSSSYVTFQEESSTETEFMDHLRSIILAEISKVIVSTREDIAKIVLNAPAEIGTSTFKQ